jgi:hypothetical protein
MSVAMFFYPACVWTDTNNATLFRMVCTALSYFNHILYAFIPLSYFSLTLSEFLFNALNLETRVGRKNAHAFLRDEGYRHDPVATQISYNMILELLKQKLTGGDVQNSLSSEK